MGFRNVKRIIQLTQGFTTLVSDCDYEFLKSHKWHASNKKSGVFAQTTLPGGKSVLMHRYILSAEKGVIVDHINGNPLDNTRENLRLATAKENSRNHKARGSSGYNGVKKIPYGWIAMIAPNGIEIALGTYPDAIKAAIAYNQAARIVYGEFARLNDVPDMPGILDEVIQKKKNSAQRLLAEIQILEGR